MGPDVPTEILIGTSGWNYATGRGTWNGVFYPSRRPRGFDELAYYAEHFDTVEVNSTFYRMPEPAMSEAWVRRTPLGFQFAIKLFQKFTHPDMYLARDGVSDWDLSRADVDLFRRGIDPLAEGGRLAALLLQFPPSFHADVETRDYLDWLLEAFEGYPLAVELRHRSWSDDGAETAARLDAHAASLVLIDEPKFSSSIPAASGRSAGGFRPFKPHVCPAARTERRAMVGARRLGRSIRLPLLDGGAQAVCQNRARGREVEPARAPVFEQPLLGEVGRQRGDPEARARSADHG